ncbi:LppU/SCO3897 family protein [Streptomyces sp. NPDC001595]|uniref:LppU/SCO3897 family protein n=1 Tax=Streptomyces sp. NPDC001532 TaxID=3154520 RepID=UPI0033292E7F
MTTPPPQGNPFAQGQPQGQNPYAQGQPQGENPFAQGQPQPGFPQQGAAPYAPVPEQPRRKLSFKTIKNIVIVIAVASVAIGGFIASRDDANTAAVGDCMHRGSTDDNNPDLEVVDCSDAKAEYVVLAKVEGSYTAMTAETTCASKAKDYQYSYTESGDGSDFLLCLKDK